MHKMLNDIKAVIFDLDGTMVNSMWMWHDIDIEYLERFNILLPEGLQAEIEGMSFHETAIYFKNRFQIEDSLEEIKASWNAMAWDKYTLEVPLKEGIKEFLELCKSRQIKLGIATSNSRELVTQILKVHEISDYFDCIMTGCDVLHGKPAPDIYLAVSEQLKIEPENCLVFEDIVPGIQAGLNAGMKVCAVEDDYSADQISQKKALANYFINSYFDIIL